MIIVPVPPMKINAATKISALIKANPEVIEAIASINRHFAKLRNPVLRKILASRVTIADAARIGGTSISVFFDKLQELGFETDNAPASSTADTQTTITLAERPNLPAQYVTLDVRETLQTGQDPFNEIMNQLAQLPAQHGLLLVNTFEPTPLIPILKKKGYRHYTEQKGPELFHTYFYPSGEASALNSNAAETVITAINAKTKMEPSFESLVQRYDGRLVEIDVRQLEMPLPMMTILETLTQLQPSQALLVAHRRVPQYLLPQLRERGFAYAITEPAPDQVQLLLYKDE